MKIAIPVDDASMDTTICVSFGRAPYFLIYDTESKNAKFISNSAAASQGGAGNVAKKFPDLELGTDIPWGGVALYTYFTDRLGEGLKQLMAGTRRFTFDSIEYEDIVALTDIAGRVTGVETLEARAERVMENLL